MVLVSETNKRQNLKEQHVFNAFSFNKTFWQTLHNHSGLLEYQ